MTDALLGISVSLPLKYENMDLIIKLLNTVANENDLILEPFAGHGSTIIAALKLKMKIFATELDIDNYKNILNNVRFL